MAADHQLKAIKDLGMTVGLTLKPKTPVEDLKEYIPEIDMVLVMTVEPGFGGQKFMPEVLPKITAAREAGGPDLLISVDGGVAEPTIARCAAAGADIFVAGSSIFDHSDYETAGKRLVDAIAQSTEAA